MIFNDFYNTLKTKLSLITDIKNIEWYFGQDKRKGGIVQAPTVLIKFKTGKPKQVSKMHQEVEIEAEIKIFTDYNKTNHKITENNIHFAIEEEIFTKLRMYEQTELIPAQKLNGLLYSSQTYKHKIVSCLPTKPSANSIRGEDLNPEIDTTLYLST